MRSVCRTRGEPSSFRLDAELTNGGFHQFFWNSEGDFNAVTDEDLAFVGALDFQRLFRRAVACATEFDVTGDKHRSENTWEEFTAGYETIPWDDFDQQYYSTAPTLFQHVARYVRDHSTDFNRNG